MFRRNIVIAVVVSFAVLDALRQAWICDDAFLSFRYAEHLSLGKGLVFNVGEYVEGYSNFLWTLFLGLGMFMGISPETFSIALGIMFFTATLLLCTRIGGGLVGLCTIAAMFHIRSYATSGLESSLFWFLLVSLLWCVQEHKVRLGGVITLLLVLCRPEGLICILLGMGAFSAKQTRWIYLRWMLPGVLLYFLWKLWYFQELLPNTYWAKGNEWRFDQGWLYFILCLKMYGLALLGFLYLFRPKSRQHVLLFGFVGLVSLQLIKGGGGFMFARLALPILIMLFLALEYWAHDKLSKQRYLVFALVMGFLVLVSPYPSEIEDGLSQGIVEEQDWYPQTEIQKAQDLGAQLRPFVEESDARIAILGAQAMLVYYAKAPYVLEAMAGLTDRELARLPAKNTRIGHGQKASLRFMQKRGIDCILTHRNRVPAPEFLKIRFGDVDAVLVQYRPEMMATWAKKGAKFVDMPTFVDRVLEGSSPPHELLSLYQILDDFYFQPANDRVRRQRFLEKLENKKSPQEESHEQIE